MADIRRLLPQDVATLHATASSPEGSAALLSAITSAAKKQQAFNIVLAALVQAGGQLTPAAAGVVAALPGPMGRVLAQQVAQQPGSMLEHAYHLGLQLVRQAERLMIRAAALLDPLLAPPAAFLATRMPPGQDTQLWGLEALLTNPTLDPLETAVGPFLYRGMLKCHVCGILEQLQAALALQHAGPAARQAAKLAKQAGGGAAEAEQLRQQLQGLWLGRGDIGSDLGVGTAGAPQGGWASSMASVAVSSSSGAGPCQPGELPGMLDVMCVNGMWQREEVLAAGDPAQWAAAVRPATPEDLRVAATALLMACKAAGAVAQLPQLLEQVQGIMEQQPWGQGLASGPAAMGLDLPELQQGCAAVADRALLLAPLLGLLLPAVQAAQLQEVAVSHNSKDGPLPTPDVASRVLGLLGHVVPPGAPGCSYPGCCNLEGRSEAELPLQVCSKCKGVHYCCREHQVAHWKAGHKEVCKLAQAAAKQTCNVAAGGSDQG
jgi:hypothetical protein